LKSFALNKLPESSALRQVLLAESRELGCDEFLHKMDVWLFLADREDQVKIHGD
jgi:hypothetical protein